jgi:chromosome segregation ATPase
MDPVQKRMKELHDRMNDLRRWHNSKQHILEIKIKENSKQLVELEARRKEMTNQLRFKTQEANKKEEKMAKVNSKVNKALGK